MLNSGRKRFRDNKKLSVYIGNDNILLPGELFQAFIIIYEKQIKQFAEEMLTFSFY
jgi:hypothetical protein